MLAVLVYKTGCSASLVIPFGTMEQPSLKKFFQPADPNAPRVFSSQPRSLQPLVHAPKAKRPVGRPRKTPVIETTPIREASPLKDTPPTSKEHQSILLDEEEVRSCTIHQEAQCLSGMQTFWLEHWNSKSVDVIGLFINQGYCVPYKWCWTKALLSCGEGRRVSAVGTRAM